jgi:hypothetical protein
MINQFFFIVLFKLLTVHNAYIRHAILQSQKPIEYNYRQKDEEDSVLITKYSVRLFVQIKIAMSNNL